MTATTSSGRRLTLELPEDEVFEDLAPRLVRLSAAAAFGFPPMLLIDQHPVSYGRLSERRLRRVLEHRYRPEG